MSANLISFHLRPARDAADARIRARIVARLRAQREEIEMFLNGVAHYNDTHPDEPPIDADPDGKIAAIKRALDESLMHEQCV